MAETRVLILVPGTKEGRDRSSETDPFPQNKICVPIITPICIGCFVSYRMGCPKIYLPSNNAGSRAGCLKQCSKITKDEKVSELLDPIITKHNI